MSSVNKAILIGHLGKDPELRYTNEGKPVANFTLATNEAWTDKGGQKQEKTEWHRIIAWDKTAELCAEHLTKGRQVYIEGRLQTREWTTKEGQKQTTTEIVANVVTFLGAKGDAAPANGHATHGAGSTEDADFGPLPPGAVAPAQSKPIAVRTDGRPTTFPNFGRSKNTPIAGASADDLEFYSRNAVRTLADPAKARFHAQEQALLDAIDAERKAQAQ